jgi:hypothetical protein
MQGASAPPDPLFIGGTGRSGTHAMARVVGHHSHYFSIPMEVKFHADPPGLPWLLSGRTTLPKFLDKLRGFWWQRKAKNDEDRGLRLRVPEERFRAAVDAFERDFSAGPFEASATLMRSLFDPYAEENGRAAWIENTNRNVAVSPMLLRLFPEAKFIHMLRDGRDSAASLVKQHWGPATIEETLDWWEERMTTTEQGAAQIPADRLLVMSFEDFVVRDRDRSYERMVEFTGLGDEKAMRAYFDDETNPKHANIGRWQKDLPQRKRRRIVKRYAKALENLIALDTPARPIFERALSEVDDPPPA